MQTHTHSQAHSFPTDGENRGIEFAGVIDLITQDPSSGRVELVMFEPRPWFTGDQGEAQLFQLQEKLNAYMGFALDGEMAEAYPDLASKPLRLVLRCVTLPPSEAVEFLSQVRDQIALQDIDLEVRYIEDDETEGSGGGHCGSGCGCH